MYALQNIIDMAFNICIYSVADYNNGSIPIEEGQHVIHKMLYYQADWLFRILYTNLMLQNLAPFS